MPHPRRGRGGRLTAIGIAAVGVVLLTASALDVQLGLPTFICGLVTASAVLALSRHQPQYIEAAMPSRRQSSEIFSSPRNPSSTMRIFSSDE